METKCSLRGFSLLLPSPFSKDFYGYGLRVGSGQFPLRDPPWSTHKSFRVGGVTTITRGFGPLVVTHVVTQTILPVSHLHSHVDTRVTQKEVPTSHIVRDISTQVKLYHWYCSLPESISLVSPRPPVDLSNRPLSWTLGFRSEPWRSSVTLGPYRPHRPCLTSQSDWDVELYSYYRGHPSILTSDPQIVSDSWKNAPPLFFRHETTPPDRGRKTLSFSQRHFIAPTGSSRQKFNTRTSLPVTKTLKYLYSESPPRTILLLRVRGWTLKVSHPTSVPVPYVFDTDDCSYTLPLGLWSDETLRGKSHSAHRIPETHPHPSPLSVPHPGLGVKFVSS